MSDWQLATLTGFRDETPRVRTLVLAVPRWTGHFAGQHIDIRLTSADGYQAQRSYSIASPGGVSHSIEITVEHLVDGEVSSYLTREFAVGDSIEVRGPIGGYFRWSADDLSPLMLIGGGSGVVPLMAILRTRDQAVERPPTRLLYSSRTIEQIIYRSELDQLVSKGDGLSLVHTLTRGAPGGWRGETRRVDQQMLARHVIQAHENPQAFVCGSTPFVETVADILLALGYAEASIRTERFGPTGEVS